ncbi:DUF6283 family protein [Streptomyces luteolus]|uniref:DUF6283 family protein n=1 Tax=Streptomyces luteolus TaxID=3043615 RepID=UPI0038D0F59C
MPYRKAPCAECPWRTDVTPGRFPDSRFEELRSPSAQPTGEDLACAGWLAGTRWENFSAPRAPL